MRGAKKQPKIKIGKRSESSFWSRILHHFPHTHFRLSYRTVELTRSARESAREPAGGNPVL